MSTKTEVRSIHIGEIPEEPPVVSGLEGISNFGLMFSDHIDNFVVIVIVFVVLLGSGILLYIRFN